MDYMRSAFLLAILTLVTIIGTAQAASFQVLQQSVASMGSANAGTATNKDDASVEYFNPAAITMIKHATLSVAATQVLAHINFQPISGTDSAGNPITSGNNVNPNANILIPAFHYILPLNNKLAVAFGINPTYV